MKLGPGEAIRKMVDTWFVTKYEYIQLGSADVHIGNTVSILHEIQHKELS